MAEDIWTDPITWAYKDKPTFEQLNEQLSNNMLHLHSIPGSINYIIDGGGVVSISTGVKGYIRVPFACHITKVSLLANETGSIVVDIWKDTFANSPPTDTDSITSATPPTISANIKSEDSTLSGWTTAVAAGDVLAFNVDSCVSIKLLSICIQVSKD